MTEVPSLAFDEEKHEYKWHGKVLPSVTTILKSAGIVDAAWYTEEARIRGTHVHQATHFYDEGDLDRASVRPEITPYLDAYIKFKQDTAFYPVLIEQRVVHSEYKYAGTLDRVGWLNDRLVQIDIKSGGIPVWAGLQTKAYEKALEDMMGFGFKLERFPEARFALQLTAQGKYKLQPLTGLSDGHYFFGALAVHQFKTA
jgi:hypothetical protein